MRKRPEKIPYLFIGIVMLVVLIFGTAWKKILYLTADPIGEKDCPPLPTTDTDKATTVTAQFPLTMPWEQKGGTVNDSSCLDKTEVYGIVRVKTVEDISHALEFAHEHKLKVSIAGVRHSQGGQAFAKQALMLDMRDMNSITINDSGESITVGAGATWHDIQNYLHPRYAVKAMQSTDIFTVGGSISVNAHGMDHQAGSVYDTLRSVRLMLADGSIVTASRSENTELFRNVVGGYGLFGVILDATLDITDNVIYESDRIVIPTSEFPETWKKIEANKDIGLFYTHLSTAPHNLLDEAILYTYTKTPADPLISPPLSEISSVKLRRLTVNLSKFGAPFRELKWWAEKYLEPRFESCEIARTEAMGTGEGCLVSRNSPMHDSVPYLKNNMKNDTDILHEYFIPRDNLMSFLSGMKEIFKRENTNVLNVSVRIVRGQDVALSYARKDAFSVVLYINQSTDDGGNAKMQKLTSDLIDLAAENGGRFFLPYQLHYSREQLEKSYTEINGFFARKLIFDPQAIFTNAWYEKYGS
jgi:FAD/FMN-containing dehydrogenase